MTCARYATGVEPERLHEVEEFVGAARAARDRGAGEFCIVVAVRGPSQRLLELDPTEVPIDFLNPRPGTPFGDRSLVEPTDALRFVALARLALPRALVRFAGGREITLRGLQGLGMRCGASGLILGDYLTTEGRGDGEDSRCSRNSASRSRSPARP